jgi:uncharacterized protein YueI
MIWNPDELYTFMHTYPESLLEGASKRSMVKERGEKERKKEKTKKRPSPLFIKITYQACDFHHSTEIDLRPAQAERIFEFHAFVIL